MDLAEAPVRALCAERGGAVSRSECRSDRDSELTLEDEDARGRAVIVLVELAYGREPVLAHRRADGDERAHLPRVREDAAKDGAAALEAPMIVARRELEAAPLLVQRDTKRWVDAFGPP